MATIVEVTDVGDVAGIILPREVLDKLHVEKGDKLHLTETETGFQLSPHDPEFEATMAVRDGSCAKIRRFLAGWRNDRAELRIRLDRTPGTGRLTPLDSHAM